MSLVSTANFNAAGNDYEADTSKLSVPVTLGVEVKAASWLTWRASIQQSVYGAREDVAENATSGRTTRLGAGAFLTWGDLQIDGTIANADARTLGTDTNFMGSVAALYRF